MTDFNSLLDLANASFSRLTPAEKEAHKRRRAVSYVYSGLLLSGKWQGTYADIERAYDERLQGLH